ncbi:DUF1566 domain-containing protein [Pseudoalteromonas sp. MMG005]|uniref:Lcl C-terminal domain-containing protein n=1 Tax=Pseudoalteromonas sp. MMG005 TaxID=2822682 RepID=UPI001B3A44CA|nr:DUF1566 domain-containing protein [Pseudoalteromonas sp. MMG005]MBQ4846492.1 DUF1566 domain-containing protein [Pseudoalteromonas sp. MMG005]
MLNRLVLPLLIGSLLVGCGGGSSSSEPAQENASINVNNNITVVEKASVTIAASASPADGVFNWQVISGPALEGFPQQASEVTITAPDVKTDSVIMLQVDYRAPNDKTASDTITINVTSENQLPIPAITQTAPDVLPAKYPDTVKLSAATSSDPDTNGAIVSYQWQQLAGPILSLSDLTQSEISFVHPLLLQTQTARFSVTIKDDEGGEASTEFSMTLAATNTPVLAEAGDEQTVTEFDVVTLDASKSVSVSGSYTCLWSQQGSNLPIVINDVASCTTTFIAPNVDSTAEVSFKVIIKDPLNLSEDDSVKVTITPKALGLRNDSGLDSCFSNTSVITCNDSTFVNQDGDVGRDSVANLIDKTGTGRVGFDFTKLNQFADELPDSETEFTCVRDNVTGLIWEVKETNTGTVPNTSIRDGKNHYTWYLSADGSAQDGSIIGPANSTCPSNVNCGIQSLIDDVNASNFCGGSNWRLPTYLELLGIIDFGHSDGKQLLDPIFFPNIPSAALLNHQYYWTTQTSVDGRSLTQAFILDMQTGNDLAYPKKNTAYVRLVRTP